MNTMGKKYQNTEQSSQLELEEMVRSLKKPKWQIYAVGVGTLLICVTFIYAWMYAMSVALN